MVEKSRIPAADSHEFANWRLPEVGSAHIVETAAERDPGSEIVARAITARDLEEITSAAQQEGHALGFEEGRADGAARGLEEGRAAARAELQEQIAALQALMAQLQEPVAAQQDAIEDALTQLAIDIAGAVLEHEPALSAAQLLPVVRTALRELPVGERNITVLLHPQQLELVRANAEWPPAWNLQADSRVECGGCRIRSEHSLIDYTVGLRFRQVAASLLAPVAAPIPEPGLLLEDHHHD